MVNAFDVFILINWREKMLKLTTKRTKWFSVPQDASGECQIEILHLKPGEVADIEAKSNQIIGRQIGDQDFLTEIGFNPNDRAKKIVNRALIEWKGFVGTNGKPLKCTEQNKMEVMREFDWFAGLIEDCRKTLADEVADEQEDAEKN